MEKGAIRKRKNRDFRFTWLDENSFRGWLAPHPTDNKALYVTKPSHVANQNY